MPTYTLQPHLYWPADLGLSGVTLASQRTSNSFHVPYRDNLDIEVALTARTSATAVIVLVEAYSEPLAEWVPVQAASVSSGVATLSDFSFSKAVSGVDNFNAHFALDRNYDLIRIKVSGTSGAAGDVVSIAARVS